jgi:hypothetical protein
MRTLNSAISQNIELFLATALISSHQTPVTYILSHIYPFREVAKLLIYISLSPAFCKVDGMITVFSFIVTYISNANMNFRL